MGWICVVCLVGSMFGDLVVVSGRGLACGDWLIRWAEWAMMVRGWVIYIEW
jgi:hypothetical protein